MNERLVSFATATAIVVVAVGLTGCVWNLVGGICTYKTVTGTAVIVSVEDAPTNGFNCNDDSVVVVFDFTPDDQTDVDANDDGQELTIGSGMNPPRTWINSNGLTVGSSHNCTRKKIQTGTCTPLIFEFTDLNYEDAQAVCN